MSFFTEMTAINSKPMVESNIAGAIGQSRATLAAASHGDGLFGRNSAVLPSQSEVVRAWLRIPGLPPSSVIPQTTALLKVLEPTTMFLPLVGGMESTEVEPRLASAGFDKDARRELRRVVKTNRDVFGVSARSPRIEESAVVDANRFLA